MKAEANAASDMLGRHLATPFAMELTSRAGSTRVESNHREILDALVAECVFGDFTGSAVLIGLARDMDDLSAPSVVETAQCLHVGFGTAGWMVIDREKRHIVGFFRSEPVKIAHALRRVLQMHLGADRE